MTTDIFATKGVEYLFVITFLLAWIAFWRLIRASTPRATPERPVPRVAPAWFSLPTDRHYHQGHTWIQPREGRVGRVGIDDFAQKLVGIPRRLELPRVGARVEQGAAAISLALDDGVVSLLAPASGSVTAVNEEVLHRPGLVNEAPYDRAWLFEMEMDRPQAAPANLLGGRLALQWMEQSAESLRAAMDDRLGVVLQDGGAPVTGIARELAGERWHELVGEYLLADVAQSLPHQ